MFAGINIDNKQLLTDRNVVYVYISDYYIFSAVKKIILQISGDMHHIIMSCMVASNNHVSLQS